MANTEVGSAFVSVYPKLTDDWGKIGDEAGTKMGGGFSTKTGAYAVAAGNLITKALGAAIDFVIDDLDEGIAKADAFNQFPKIMENMGFEAEQAQASIEQMMDHLQGLPTATQDLLPFVQAVASVTGDLERATDFGLAFNDMLVANGASAGDASRAMEMLDKMLSSGEYNAVRWTSIMSVMRPQLDQVAEAMLGAGANAVDLGNALGDGTVSFDELIDAIIRLDEDGGESLKSFHQQAADASGGIGTAVDNIHNKIQTGWKEIIDAIGEENIINALNALGQAFYDVMYAIAHFDQVCQAMYDTVEGVVFGIGDTVAGFFISIWDGFNAFADELYNGVNGFMQGIVTTVTGLIDGLVSGVSGSFVAMRDTVVGIWDGLQQRAGEIFQGIQSFIEDPIGAAASFVGSAVDEILGFFTGLGDRITSAIGSIHFPTPHIDWGEELNIAGINTGVRLPTITWNARGGYYDNPTLIGVGEKGGELVLPQSGGIMDPFANAVAERVENDDADRVIAWLDDNLPYIIAHFTPTVGQRDFDRMARRATA